MEPHNGPWPAWATSAQQLAIKAGLPWEEAQMELLWRSGMTPGGAVDIATSQAIADMEASPMRDAFEAKYSASWDDPSMLPQRATWVLAWTNAYASLVARMEIVGYRTHHDQPMFFPTRAEALTYCDSDEVPVPLVDLPGTYRVEAETGADDA